MHVGPQRTLVRIVEGDVVDTCARKLVRGTPEPVAEFLALIALGRSGRLLELLVFRGLGVRVSRLSLGGGYVIWGRKA